MTKSLQSLVLVSTLLLAGCDPDCGEREVWSGSYEVGGGFADVPFTVYFHPDHELGVSYFGPADNCVMDDVGAWSVRGDSVHLTWESYGTGNVAYHGVLDSAGTSITGTTTGNFPFSLRKQGWRKTILRSGATGVNGSVE